MTRFSRYAVLVAIAGCLLLASCLPFPLGDPEKSKIDSKLVGYWISDNKESPSLAIVYPFDGHAYLIEQMQYSNGATKERKGHGLYKAWLTDVKGTRFLTLEPLLQRLPASDNAKKAYPAVKITLTGDALDAQAINDELAGFSQVKNAEEMTAFIEREVGNDSLYRAKEHYRKLDPQRDAGELEPITKLFE